MTRDLYVTNRDCIDSDRLEMLHKQLQEEMYASRVAHTRAYAYLIQVFLEANDCPKELLNTFSDEYVEAILSNTPHKIPPAIGFLKSSTSVYPMSTDFILSLDPMRCTEWAVYIGALIYHQTMMYMNWNDEQRQFATKIQFLFNALQRCAKNEQRRRMRVPETPTQSVPMAHPGEEVTTSNHAAVLRG